MPTQPLATTASRLSNDFFSSVLLLSFLLTRCSRRQKNIHWGWRLTNTRVAAAGHLLVGSWRLHSFTLGPLLSVCLRHPTFVVERRQTRYMTFIIQPSITDPSGFSDESRLLGSGCCCEPSLRAVYGRHASLRKAGVGETSVSAGRRQ